VKSHSIEIPPRFLDQRWPDVRFLGFQSTLKARRVPSVRNSCCNATIFRGRKSPDVKADDHLCSMWKDSTNEIAPAGELEASSRRSVLLL
jgi:hypothetical protein